MRQARADCAEEESNCRREEKFRARHQSGQRLAQALMLRQNIYQYWGNREHQNGERVGRAGKEQRGYTTHFDQLER